MTLIYNVAFSGASSGNIVSGGRTRYGIVFETGSSLVGSSIAIWTNQLKKQAGATGTITGAIYNASDTLVATANESFDVSTLATTYGTTYTWTFPTPRTIVGGDHLVVEYSGATTVNIRIHSPDQFDAGNTRRTSWNGTAWVNSSSEDIDGTIDDTPAVTRISLSRIYLYNVQSRTSLSRVYKYNIIGRISLSRIYKYHILGRISLSRIYKYNILARISLSRIYKYNIIGRISLSRVYKYNIIGRISLSRIYKYNVIGRVSLSRIYKYNVLARVSLSRTYLWNVLSSITRVSKAQIYKYNVQARVSLSNTYKYNILSRVSLSRIYKYNIIGRISLARTYLYNVIGRISLSRIYKYNITNKVSLSRTYKYNILGRVSLPRVYKYNVIGRLSVPKVYKWNVGFVAPPPTVGGGRRRKNAYRNYIKSLAFGLKDFFKIKQRPPPPEEVEIPEPQPPQTVTILPGPPTAKTVTKLKTINDKWSIVASVPPPETRTEVIYPVIINPSQIPLTQTKVIFPPNQAIKQPYIPTPTKADGSHLHSEVGSQILPNTKKRSKVASTINTLMILLEIERQI